MTYILRLRSCRVMGEFVISPLPSLSTKSICAAGSPRSTGVAPLQRYYGPSRHRLVFSRFPGGTGYTTYLAPCRSRSALAAENLFLRKQLTFFVERKQAPRRTDNATRVTMATLAMLFDWKEALIVVKPDTLIFWHRKGFRLFWRWKSRPKGRPTLPEELKKLIAEMAVANINVGRREDRPRAARQAWRPRLAAHRSEVHTHSR